MGEAHCKMRDDKSGGKKAFITSMLTLGACISIWLSEDSFLSKITIFFYTNKKCINRTRMIGLDGITRVIQLINQLSLLFRALTQW